MQLPCTRNCRRLPRVPANLWVCVGFEGGFGPKGLGNSAQALAWVPLFLRASPRKGAGQCRGNPYRPHPNSDDYLLRPTNVRRLTVLRDCFALPFLTLEILSNSDSY